MRKIVMAGAAAAATVVLGVPAAAETLPVAGVYAARTDGAVGVSVIALESFGGDMGAEVSFALDDALASVSIEGQDWFLVVPTSGDDVDAVFRGSASSDVSYRRIDDKKKEGKCLEKNDKGKCIERETIYVRCREMLVELRPSVRLIAVDGRQLYDDRDTLSETRRFCEDESEPSSNSVLDKLASEYAAKVRLDLAPVYRSEGIRVMETRKDLNKADRNPFRDAVRQTKSDVSGACDAFAALEVNNPGHVSVLYNIGLCAEGQNDFASAQSYYQRALAIEPDKEYPAEGLRRIRDKERAMRQIDEHFAPFLDEASVDAAGEAPGDWSSGASAG